MDTWLHQFVLKFGQKVYYKKLLIFYLPVNSPKLAEKKTSSKFSISISKKVIPKSFKRHKVKRILKEKFRTHRDWIGKYHIFIIVKADLLAKAKNVDLDLEEIFNKFDKNKPN